jgi:hypothetical protein
MAAMLGVLGQRGFGQVLEATGEEEQRHHGQRRDHQAGQLGVGSGRAVHRRLREASVDDHPARQARPDIRRPEPEQLPVGVDLVVVPGGVGLGRAQALGEAHEHDPDTRRHRRQVVGHADAVGQPDRRKPAVDAADDREAVVGQVEHGDQGDAAEHDGERAGNHGSVPPQDQHHRQGTEADRHSQGVAVIEMSEHPPRLFEEVALPLLDPEKLGNLANDDRERQPDDEPLEHRLGDEVGQEAQATQTATIASTPVMRATTTVYDATSLGSATRSATAAADRAAVAAIGPVTRCRELPNAA